TPLGSELDADLVADGLGDLADELRAYATRAPEARPGLSDRVLGALADELVQRPPVVASATPAPFWRLTFGLRPASFRSLLAAAALVAALGAGVALAGAAGLRFDLPNFDAPAQAPDDPPGPVVPGDGDDDGDVADPDADASPDTRDADEDSDEHATDPSDDPEDDQSSDEDEDADSDEDSDSDGDEDADDEEDNDADDDDSDADVEDDEDPDDADDDDDALEAQPSGDDSDEGDSADSGSDND
ncbi:MAG: hypothetical protein L0227_08840, partial [Chloroflexi bacterium]|nr:hypothetical protein [Chloroflexota bacterium]